MSIETLGRTTVAASPENVSSMKNKYDDDDNDNDDDEDDSNDEVFATCVFSTHIIRFKKNVYSPFTG